MVSRITLFVLMSCSALTSQVPYLGVNYVGYANGGYPFETAWRAQTYHTSRAVRGCRVTAIRPFSGKGSLECEVELIGGDPEFSQGESYVNLNDSPPSCSSADGLTTASPICPPTSINVAGTEISVRVYVSKDAIGSAGLQNFVQLIAKSTDPDDPSKWHYFASRTYSITGDGWIELKSQIRNPDRLNCDDKSECAEPKFDPHRVVLLGVKFGSSSLSTHRFFGKVWIDDMRWRDTTNSGCDPVYHFENIYNSIQELSTIRANAAALVITWYQADSASTRIFPDGLKTQSDGEVFETIRRLHAAGISVILKPHVDVYDGSFRGNLAPRSTSTWFDNYKEMILHYVRIVSAVRNLGPDVAPARVDYGNAVEVIVLGTELDSLFVPENLAFWKELAAAVRAELPNVKVTFATNWDKIAELDWRLTADSANVIKREALTKFWQDLEFDYVGIDAYFPLSNKVDPTIEELQAGWDTYEWPPEKGREGAFGVGRSQHWVNQIEEFQRRIQKPVIFTEAGLRSARCAAKEPSYYGVPGNIFEPPASETGKRRNAIDEEDLEELKAVLDGVRSIGNVTSGDLDGSCAIDAGDLNTLKMFLENNGPSVIGAGNPPPFPLKIDTETQVRYYRATNGVFRTKSWFKGVLWWAWYPDSAAGGMCSIDFTPQQKPASREIAREP